ncbi:hypothetical protein ES332_D05G432400v1 [Gossypium tomentosum]|uniref:AAA+ ATPase domain-containing protein n=1 Tax=Gossypium tomentosum TaxID=34277 RepID=A0A5D2L726_GOSTO|nr:hypothetical protein ES332_D05G432400v1 [Gossypium tomentosum]
MAEYAAPAAVEIVADQAKEYASPYLRYFFRYGEIVEDFKNQREALELKKERVKIRVDEAERQNELIHKDVDNWLTSAEKELKETQNLKDEIDRVKCFKWCPKWGWRYSLSKKLAEKIPIISKLLETSNFAQVGYRRPLQGIEFIRSTDFMHSKSSKSAFNQIMEAINAKGVNMIGLQGMPGVGKTTLAKEVGKHAREQKFFDKVVMFTMSQNADINKIQDKVADIFGLKFETSSQEGKAEELFRSMQRVKKILVIVDDLWEEFKLEDIGIPFGDDHKGCKILLTTRQQQVCSKMKCQKEIQLGILSKDEAWVLFRDKAGLEDDCSTLNDVAKEVAAECKGLPLAIVVVAKALKGESLNGWRDANQRFKDSTHLYDEEVLGGVLEPLKLSYDYLKKGINQMTGINDIQICFLLCSLFPEDEEIDTEILIMCGIGVGLFPNFYSIEDKRKKIVEALKKLQKSGLLLETDGADTIRIHDVIRDFAHWLTSTGENRFMIKDTLKEWPHMDESYTAIALWNCSSIINIFPDKVEFSKLKTLFLEGERKRNRDDFLVVLGTFFEEMKALQVLLLKRVSFSLKGFPSLPNLKTLRCYDCMLKNFSSSLTNMRSLEILALIATEIDEISEELVKLSALKYLRLSGVGVEREMNIPPNLVSRLTSLQELHVIPKNNLNLLELKSLSRLTALSLRLSANQIPLEDFMFPKLQRYDIVGQYYSSDQEAFRRLAIQDFSSSLSAFNNLFCNVEALSLRNVGGQKNIVPSMDEMGVNELTSLQLKSCNDMEFLIDTKKDQGSTVAFSNLVELIIESMASLKGLCYGVSPTRFLQNLKEVIIKDCEELQVIFQIDKLSEKMKCQTPLLSNLTILRLHSLPKLKRIWEVKPSHRAIASLQSLKVVSIESCDNLKTIFSPCLALSMLHLQQLYISYCDRLEQVIGFGQEDEIIENDCLLYCWPKLRVLRIKDCESLKYISTNTLIQSLEYVYIANCHQLVQIYNMEQNIVLPGLGSQEYLTNLTSLELRSLPKLKYMWNGPLVHLQYLVIWNCNSLEHLSNIKDQSSLFLPKLKDVRISGCENLKYLCSSQGLPCLEAIDIKDCPRLIQIFNMENNKDGFGLQNDSSLCCWPKLRILRIEFCRNLKYVCANTWTQGLQSLESVYIRHCSQLIQVFNMEQNKHAQDIVLPELGSQNHCWTKLKTLRIEDCQLLKYLFANTLSQGFPLLESIYLKNCPQLLQVFSSTEERDVIDDHILLNVPFLKNLEVSNCPQISCFIIQAQLIEDLVLSNVGNSRQLCNTDVPVLNEGCIVVGNQEEVFQVQGGYSFSTIKLLELRNLFEVRVIWNDFAQIVTLENLTTLTLSGCNKLRYIFSPMMARSLSHLVDLFIEWCEEIERLILAKDQVSSSSSNGDTSLQPMSFPNLKRIVVINCKNLNSLFPFGFVPVLPKLETLIVTRNSKLEQVFELEEKVEVVAEEEMKFDKLEWLSLEKLPGLIHFCPKGYHFVFPAMIELEVRDCPKLATGFFIDSQEFVHCKTKATQLVEQVAVEESTTVRNAIFNENIDWSRGGGESQLPHIT